MKSCYYYAEGCKFWLPDPKPQVEKEEAMYWLVIFSNGKQMVVKANNTTMLGEKVDLAEVLTIIKLSNDIFENLSEI